MSSILGPAQSRHRALSPRSAQDAAGPQGAELYDLAMHGWCQGWADGRSVLAAASLAVENTGRLSSPTPPDSGASHGLCSDSLGKKTDA